MVASGVEGSVRTGRIADRLAPVPTLTPMTKAPCSGYTYISIRTESPNYIRATRCSFLHTSAMHNHWLFAWNVLAHWVASMSSIVSFTLGVVELLRNRKTEAWIFWAIACLFLTMAFDQAWQDEHRNAELLKTEKSSAVGDREFWKSQSYEKDSALRQCGQSVNGLQGTLNLCVSGSVEKLKKGQLALVASKMIVPDIPKYARFQQILLMSNQPVEVEFRVHCDSEIAFVSAALLNTSTVMGGRGGGRISPTDWDISIGAPLLTPSTPLDVVVYYSGAKEPTCSFSRIGG